MNYPDVNYEAYQLWNEWLSSLLFTKTDIYIYIYMYVYGSQLYTWDGRETAYIGDSMPLYL